MLQQLDLAEDFFEPFMVIADGHALAGILSQ
jgi:hypothetical protein